MSRSAALLLVLLSGCTALSFDSAAAEREAAEFFGEPGTKESRNFLARYLISIEEPSLFKTRHESAREQYRITVLPSFESPQMMRIDLHGDTGTVILKRPGSMDLEEIPSTGTLQTFQPVYGPLTINRERPLSPDEVQTVRRAVEAVELSSFREEPPDTGDLILDGATVVFEAVRDGEYLRFRRVFPSFDRICDPKKNAMVLQRWTAWRWHSEEEVLLYTEGLLRLRSLLSSLLRLAEFEDWQLAPCPGAHVSSGASPSRRIANTISTRGVELVTTSRPSSQSACGHR